MKKADSPLTLEEGILILQEQGKDFPVSVEEILHILSEKGLPLILLFLSLPFCQPIQIPGLSTPFGFTIVFIGLRMTFKKSLWLPKWLLIKTISPQVLQKLTKKTLYLVRKLNQLIYPRFAWLCYYPASQLIHGLLITLLGIVLTLPLPIPLSNLMAAWSIFFIGLGLLENNGIFILIGYLISIITSAFFIILALSLMHIF